MLNTDKHSPLQRSDARHHTWLRNSDWLSSHWIVGAACALGVLLCAPSITSGFHLDDYLHWAMLTGRVERAHPASPVGMFAFFDGSLGQHQAFVADGTLPWWTAQDFKMSFWRPLAELSHLLDYTLWPHSSVAMHIHNLFWYGLLIFLVAQLYRTLDPDRRRAGLATLMYGTCGLHSIAASWIANRNGLIANVFGVAATLLFVAARTRRNLILGLGSLILFACGLLCGDIGVTALGLLTSHAAIYALDDSKRSRVLQLVPFGLVVLIWKVSALALGYGTHGSSRYIDPISDPLRFISELGQRWPILICTGLSGLPAGLVELVAPAILVPIALGIIAVIGVALSSRKLLSQPWPRFCALSALLCTMPVCATVPEDRLLLAANVGATGLLAALLNDTLPVLRGLRPSMSRSLTVLVGALLTMRVVLSPVMMVAGFDVWAKVSSRLLERPTLGLPAPALDQNAHVFIVNQPFAPLVSFMPFVLMKHGLTAPSSIVSLGPGTRALHVRSTDEYTLVLEAQPSLLTPVDRAFREASLVMHAGDEVALGDATIRVLRVDHAGNPSRISARFQKPLRDAGYRFLQWVGEGYRPLDIPDAVGVALPPCELASLLN